MTAATHLAQGIAAARAGRHDEARAALLRALEADDRNESAWLWLSGVAATPVERRICLENVLAINPANNHARRGLALLGDQPAAPGPAPAAAVALTAPATPTSVSHAGAIPAPHVPPSVSEAGAQPYPRPSTPDAPLPDPQPTALWLPRPPATGATMKLDASTRSAIALSPDALPPIPIEEMDDEEPCPYCGATTLLRERSCRSCRKSLMVRRQPRDKRSVALTILAGLWMLSSLGLLPIGVAQIAGLVMLLTQAQSLGQELPIMPLVALIVGFLIGTALCTMTGLGLFRRRRWAYITHWATLAFGLVMSAVSTMLLGAGIIALGDEAAGQLAAAGSIGGVVLCNLVVYAVYITLTVLSHRDFYGEMARLTIDGISTGEEPYNAGILYRNRGMWYMAAHAWERATHQSPLDATARRALGLAYAQLRRYDQARVALREAMALAPNEPQLAEDLAIVEGLAAQAARKARPSATRAPQR